jgi:hypothetical protein
MERTIYLTNINYKGINKSGHCRNRVEVELELTNDNCFSATACVWNENHSDIYMGGQCFDDLKEIPEVGELPIFKEIYDLWKKYHLNDLHAGTKEQEDILKEAVKTGELEGYGANYYKETCDYLESKDMLYDKKYLVEKKQADGTIKRVPYRYGTGWLKEEIPEEDLLRIKSLIQKEKIYEPEEEYER